MSVNFTELFKHDTQLLKALEAAKKAGTTLDSTRSALIARTITFAYERKDAQIINSACDFYGSEGVKGMARPFAYALTTILKGMFKEMQAGRRVVYIPNDWADHDKVCRILKEHDIVKECKDAAAKEREAARSSKPAELIEAYGPESHHDSTANRVDKAIASLIKASDKDRNALNASAIDGKDKAIAYLRDESTDLVALRELCVFLSSHKITFRDALNKLQALN